MGLMASDLSISAELEQRPLIRYFLAWAASDLLRKCTSEQIIIRRRACEALLELQTVKHKRPGTGGPPRASKTPLNARATSTNTEAKDSTYVQTTIQL